MCLIMLRCYEMFPTTPAAVSRFSVLLTDAYSTELIVLPLDKPILKNIRKPTIILYVLRITLQIGFTIETRGQANN